MGTHAGWMVAEWDSTSGTWDVDGTPWMSLALAERERDAECAAHGGRWAVAEVVVDESTAVGEP